MSKMTMSTYEGHIFWPDDPHKSLSRITITDIAHALSYENRFGGHIIHTYSVASHSIWCAKAALDTWNDIRLALYMLMHDAQEAYLKDLPTPVKVLFPEYIKLEDKWQEAIHKKFNVPILNDVDMKRAKEIDQRAGYVEAITLQPFQTWVPEHVVIGEEELLHDLDHVESKAMFLTMFHRLQSLIEQDESSTNNLKLV